MIKIAVDLKGADSSESTLIDGVLKALAENDDLYVCMCGNKTVMHKELEDKEYPADRLELVHAPQVITNSDDPFMAARTKKESSLVKGLRLCRENGDIEAFVTCGATGAIMVAAMMTLKKAHRRPTLLCELKQYNKKPFCLVDCGANVDCFFDKLLHFARVGDAYMRAIGFENPRVALLSNGAEKGKGNMLTKNASGLLQRSNLNFIGNIEGTDMLKDVADVVVCEGFAGNILLKTIEGSIKGAIMEGHRILETMPEEHREGARRMLDALYDSYNYNETGGAILFGFQTPIIKGHGAASAETIYTIVSIAYKLAKNKIAQKMLKTLK